MFVDAPSYLFLIVTSVYAFCLHLGKAPIDSVARSPRSTHGFDKRQRKHKKRDTKLAMGHLCSVTSFVFPAYRFVTGHQALIFPSGSLNSATL